MPNQQMASSCIIYAKPNSNFQDSTTLYYCYHLYFFKFFAVFWPNHQCQTWRRTISVGGNNVGIFATSFTAAEEPFVSLFRDLRHFLWVGLAAGCVCVCVRKMLVKDKCVSFVWYWFISLMDMWYFNYYDSVMMMMMMMMIIGMMTNNDDNLPPPPPVKVWWFLLLQALQLKNCLLRWTSKPQPEIWSTNKCE